MQNKNLTLLIMAAGMGSRFGGLKQIEPIGPNGEFITDYSIYDAKLAGVEKIVFIIKEEHLEIFKNTIGARIKESIPVEYVFQKDTIELENKTYKRQKPWGTAHAILAAKEQIDGDFIVINSDDFYGRTAYFDAVKFFQKNRKENEFGLVGYKVSNTLTENGSVKRGVCAVENGFLKHVIESKIEKVQEKIIATPLNESNSFEVKEDTLVSMNMFLFTPYIFKLIEEELKIFIEENKGTLETAEYLIPDLIQRKIDEKKITMEVFQTTAKWEGVTYKEDKEKVVSKIREKIELGEYQKDLWQES